jgi:hypothetical protein
VTFKALRLEEMRSEDRQVSQQLVDLSAERADLEARLGIVCRNLAQLEAKR